MIKQKLLFLGDGSVGKSTILHQYCKKNDIKNISSTIGIDYLTKYLDNNIILQLWDCAGQERFHSIIDSYYRSANYIVLVFDLNDIETLQNIDKYWMNIINKKYDSIDYPKIYLVGNKCDINYNKEILYDIKLLKEKYNMAYFELSGIHNKNVHKLLDSIINDIMNTNKDIIIDILDNDYNPQVTTKTYLENAACGTITLDNATCDSFDKCKC